MNEGYGMDQPRPGDWAFPASGDPRDDDDFEDDEDILCPTCGGERVDWCDGGPNDIEDLCFIAKPHLHPCPSCGGLS